MAELQVTSIFEFDEHRHLFSTMSDQPVAKLRFTQLQDSRDSAVICEVAAKVVFGAAPEDEVRAVVEYQRMSLTNKTSANGWGKVSQAMSTVYPDCDWDMEMQQAIAATMKVWREGTAMHAPLESVDPETVASPFLVNPLISSSGMTMHYSPPGAGKSMIALALAVSVSTGFPIFGSTPSEVGPVIYVDFEDVKRTHDQRLTAILKGMKWDGDLPDITHYKVAGKLTDHLAPIRSLAREKEAVLVIVDSLGKARGADPSDGDATIKLTNAIESLNMPVLAIDHVTKSHNEDIASGKMQNPEAVMGIGSQFSTAGARLGWFFQKMTMSKPLEVIFTLHNNKHNLVAKQASRSMTMEIENNDRGVITQLKFQTWDQILFQEMEVEGPHVAIARWMLRTNKISTTGAEAAKGTGLSKSGTGRALIDNPDWFEKIAKVRQMQPYRLTDAGKEAMGETLGQASEDEDDETQ